MSDIPKVRRLLNEALSGIDPFDALALIAEALPLLDRKKPDFVAPRRISPLTEGQKDKARDLRTQGLPVNEIARRLHTNIGRVSEAVNA